MPDRRQQIVLALVAVALAIALIAPWAARADGDPASDTLLIQSLYTPVSQKISPNVQTTLQNTIKAADAGGFKVRVALILDRTDLGAVPQLFGHPDQYVHLLSGELYYGWKGAIIAVQPSGIGVRNVKPLAQAQTLVNGISIAKPATADGLATAATEAVQKLAAAQGVKLSPAATTTTAKPGGSGRSTTTTILGAVLVVVLVALFVGQLIVRRRRTSAG